LSDKPAISYGRYLTIWLALLVLTAVTITAVGIQFGRWSVFAAIAIAAVKGTLVLFYFMHLRYEGALIRITLSLAVLTLAVIMVLTFADVSFR